MEFEIGTEANLRYQHKHQHTRESGVDVRRKGSSFV
jgi:hypothetical protein